MVTSSFQHSNSDTIKNSHNNIMQLSSFIIVLGAIAPAFAAPILDQLLQSAASPLSSISVLPTSVREALVSADDTTALSFLQPNSAKPQSSSGTFTTASAQQQDPLPYAFYCENPNFDGSCQYGVMTRESLLQCFPVSENLNDKISSYRVGQGCCGFYRNGGCDDRLFTADRRSDAKLGPEHDNQISSYKCNFTCDGL
ncbi:Similar to hypothetical protein [Podospora anserina S mat+]; acc. no. XP_001903708 [Pyronema omphalodes CBS 100304]|uniref:Uncharacterized protein n=1 Tax=Pyronema omphalodes (strain CBS 100304) TaxID=1076935 RepID=U4LNK6_PYROM|nr:Similar to hypothetical protein [Podospora anserina S mat+]; acc. no. XP_001903708 [Pyronema omphalodes CBS 100304]